MTVYETRGQYQIIVRAVELQGVGALQIAFEKLKQKLAAEGLFAPETKTSIAEISAAHRFSHIADRRGDSRCVARHPTEKSGTGNHFYTVSRAGRRCGGRNCGGNSVAEWNLGILI